MGGLAPRPGRFTPRERDAVPILQEAGWAPGTNLDGWKALLRRQEVSLYETVNHGTVELHAGRSGNRISVEAKFSAPVQTGPWAHPASFTIGAGTLSLG